MAVSILTNEFVGEFMRSFIAVVALAAITGGVAVAEEQGQRADSGAEVSFSEDGTYIAPGMSEEIVIAGECRLLRNQDAQIGYYITPTDYNSWQDVWKLRHPREPLVTEAPCK